MQKCNENNVVTRTQLPRTAPTHSVFSRRSLLTNFYREMSQSLAGREKPVRDPSSTVIYGLTLLVAGSWLTLLVARGVV